jgi:hypothetical protein
VYIPNAGYRFLGDTVAVHFLGIFNIHNVLEIIPVSITCIRGEGDKTQLGLVLPSGQKLTLGLLAIIKF